MNPKPLFLSENFFNEIQFTGHTVSANEEDAGCQGWRVATGRRLNSRNKWTPVTNNADAWIKVACDQAREADTIVLDRGHNLGGYTIQLQNSADDSSYSNVFSLTLPTAAVSGTSLDAATGAQTEEGAWCLRFTGQTKQYWRLYIPAMGANYKPEIVGLYLGLSYEPSYYFDLPLSDESGESYFNDVMSPFAWVASSLAAHRRSGTIYMRLSSDSEYDTARYHIKQNFMEQRRLMWIWHNQENAERAVLARHNAGQYGFTRQAGWSFRQVTIPWFEHEPLIT